MFFFDVNSEKYVLNKINEGCPILQISEETRESLSSNRWKYQKAPGIFSFGNFKKFREELHTAFQIYHDEIFRRLENAVMKEINKFRTSSKTALQEIESEIRSAFLSKVKQKMEEQSKEQLRNIGKRLQEAVSVNLEPFEKNHE